jgi:hypothetical protein
MSFATPAIFKPDVKGPETNATFFAIVYDRDLAQISDAKAGRKKSRKVMIHGRRSFMLVGRIVVDDGVDYFLPIFDGDLAGADGRGATVAIIKDLQKVAPFGRMENRKAPVIEDQELNATDGFEQAAISAVAAS